MFLYFSEKKTIVISKNSKGYILRQIISSQVQIKFYFKTITKCLGFSSSKAGHNLLVSSFFVCFFSNVSQKACMCDGVGVRSETVERWAASWRWPLLQAAGAWAHRTRALQNALRIGRWRTYPWAFSSHSRKVAPKAVHFCASACGPQVAIVWNGWHLHRPDGGGSGIAGVDMWVKIF